MNGSRGKLPRWFATRWAGAAVAALRCGVAFDRVWADATPAGGLAGGLESPRPGEADVTPLLPLPEAEARALAAYAGPCAEARERGVRIEDVLRRDPAALDPFRAALGADPSADAPARNAALARDLFNRPKVWAEVNAVAGALQGRRTLSFYEVLLIVERMEREA